MENDTFGGAILAWVKSLRRAGHGMPRQRHGPVQGKLHPRRGVGIELPASLRHRLRQGRHRGTDGRMTPPFHLVGGSLPLAPATPSWRATTRHLAVSSATPSAGTPRNAPLISAAVPAQSVFLPTIADLREFPFLRSRFVTSNFRSSLRSQIATSKLKIRLFRAENKIFQGISLDFA